MKSLWEKVGVLICIIALGLGYAMWRQGWIVAKNEYVQVRKVPLANGIIAIPGTTEFCYVIEVGHYPYSSTFRVRWDSFVADKIVIELPSQVNSKVRIHFGHNHEVEGLLGGDIQSAEWRSQ